MGDTLVNPANDQGQSNVPDWGKMTIDESGFTKLLENETFKKVYEPHKDRVVNQAIKTYTANKQKDWEQEKRDYAEQIIREKFPAETEDQKKNRELARALDEEKRVNKIEKLKNKGLNYMNAKGLDDFNYLADRYAPIAKDEDDIMEMIDQFEVSVKAREKRAAEKMLATTTTKTQSGDSDPTLMFTTQQQWQEFFKRNPDKAKDERYQDAFAKWCNSKK